jgi:hypothetical protein
MSTYEWKIVFRAEDDADANEQVEEALNSFHSIVSDDLIELDPSEGA